MLQKKFQQPLSSLHLAIPAMNEADFLPRTIDCLLNQHGFEPDTADQNGNPKLHIWVCVNQPESYRDHADKQHICQNNNATLAYLNKLPLNNLHIIDRSNPGKGWTAKDHGVGMARKVLMDSISKVAEPKDIILSMDADSLYSSGYLASVAELFEKHPYAVALSNPYYHQLTNDEVLDRAVLRYEIYMRYYALNMWRIGSPYNFTALGSAIALPVWAYRKIGGMTAKKSGEDFYLLQKLRKMGRILTHNLERVYPGTRYSDRVFFGTGPALIKGSQGLWDSYPIYDHRWFDRVATTYNSFPVLFESKVDTPMDAFLENQFRTEDIFIALRKNATNIEQFVKACHHKIDGLRVLQFLKASQTATSWSDAQNLNQFLHRFYPGAFALNPSWDGEAIDNLNFSASPVDFLDKIRNFLMEKESSYQETDLNTH